MQQPSHSLVKALRIIQSHTIERPGQFARYMWPNAEGWQHHGDYSHP